MALEAVQLYNMLGGNYKSTNTCSYDDLLDQHLDKSPYSFDYFLGNDQTETCPDHSNYYYYNHPEFEDVDNNNNNNVDNLPDNNNNNNNSSTTSTVPRFGDHNYLSLEGSINGGGGGGGSSTMIAGELQPLDGTIIATSRPKRRCRSSRARKNKEEIENQRMTHIAVERNRRKQMNEYLSVLRSLMPESYVQRGDQASIIGGAINFVKELEQQVQFFGVRKVTTGDNNNNNNNNNNNVNNGNDDGAVTIMPFSEFFSFPQYTTSGGGGGAHGGCSADVADVEVTMVESHVNVKIRSKKRPKQLLMVVSGLHTLRLTVLHLNVTTEDQIVLYSLSVKVEDDSTLTSVEEIATGIYQILVRINQKEALVMN